MSKKMEGRAEGFKKAFDKYLDLVEEAEQAGDLIRLRRNLEYAIEAWLGYTNCSSSNTIRASREANAEKLIDWLESLPTDPADLPSPNDGAATKKRPAVAKRGAGGDKDKEDKGGNFIPVEKPSLRFDDIAGLDDVKEEIRLKMIYPYTHPEAAARYKIRRGGGILLWGPPGTGKTMMARAVAGEIDAAFFTVKPSEIMSKWVGDSEGNIQALFKAARSHERSIVFIDEIEALIPSRRDNQSSVMTRLVPQILAELEGFDTSSQNPLLFIGATNEPWSLDPAVLRPGRFDEKVYVGLPDFKARRKIMELNLDGRPLNEDVNLDTLAERCEGFSGADMKNLCEKAASEVFLKAVRSRDDGVEETDIDPPIGMADLESAIRQATPSVSASDLESFLSYRDATSWTGTAPE